MVKFVLCETHLLTKNFSTMNTKKLIAGIMAMGFFALTVVSTTVIVDDVFDTEVSIERKGIKRI